MIQRIVLLIAAIVMAFAAAYPTVSMDVYVKTVNNQPSAVAVPSGSPAPSGGWTGPAAHVDYSPTMLTLGWDQLNVTSFSLQGTIDDLHQAYAAGFAEGAVTFESSWNNYVDTHGSATAAPYPTVIAEFISTNWAWMNEQVLLNSETSAIWKQVGLQMMQFNGLLDGLNSVAAPTANQSFTFDMLQGLQVMGDLYDLEPALLPTARKELDAWRTMAKKDYDVWFARKTRCSALIKLAFDYSDIFFGHATWSTFNTMLRSFKHYTLNYGGVAAKTVSFSSYPGTLASIDDYYMTDSGLAIIETSIAILNTSLYNNETIRPQSLLYWVRVMTTTRLATSAAEWVSIFAQYNSGTYNNQWMVLDLNKFTPYQDLQPETLMIAEQFPGVVGIKDRTKELQYGYWPSYNIPSIPELYVLGGYAEATQTQGWEMNDYERCVRAQIFRRDQTNVFDMPAFMTIMQYNQYQSDPISQGNPIYAIASRGDLMPVGEAQCFGAIDAKVSSYYMYQNGREILAYSGPTPQQIPLNFATTNATGSGCGPTQGMPTKYDFMWTQFTPFV